MVANNNSSSTVVCKIEGEVTQTYGIPRTPTYTTDAIACIARVTTSTGATDYKSEGVLNTPACKTFCNAVNPRGGVKTCYKNGTSLQEYYF